MDDEQRNEDEVPTPMSWEPPRSEAELRAEQREVREAANSETAFRAYGVAGALGANVPIGSGAVMGRGGALGVEETQREEALDERIDLEGPPGERPDDADPGDATRRGA